MAETREPQYEVCFDVLREAGRASFGLMSNQVWHDDPKRLVFLLARYKFVAKMFSGLPRVLEVGCADAFGTRVVRQEVPHVTAVDFDPLFIDDVRQRADARWPIEARVHDMLAGPVPGGFDGAYALDVLEHIPAAQEDRSWATWPPRSTNTARSSSACLRSSRRPMPRRRAGRATSTARTARG